MLDSRARPVARGEQGQIFIGGVWVGTGYVGQPDLTAEHFIPNPFPTGGPTLYRTGDLGRMLPDGNIQFCGRADDH